MGVARSVAVLGHGFSDAGSLPVSTPLLLLGAAAIVLAATRLPPRTDTSQPALAEGMGRRAAGVLRILASLVLLLITASAVLGPGDAAENPAGRVLFTVGWAGLLVVAAVAGPWWRRANPLRLAAVDGGGSFRGVGIWPAVAAVIAFGAAEQLLDPTPLVALVVVAVYVVGGSAGAVVYGGRWLDVTDPAEATSNAIGALAPLGRGAGGLAARSSRAGVRALDAPPGLAALLGALVGLGVFDAATGDTGTSSPLWFAVWVVGAAAAFTVVARPHTLAAALIPAAAGHLGAHYLAPLLIDTQVVVVQASDPFGRGWDLLGLTGTEIVAEPIPPEAGLVVQLVLLVAGHALAMVAAGDIASRVMPARAVSAAVFPLRAAVLASLLVGVYYWVAG